MLPSAVLLPTPAVNDMGEGKTVEAWDEWTGAMKAKHGNGNGHGPSLAIETQRSQHQWGKYADAVHRWERLTRPAPAATEPGRNGGRRLSPRFCEFMMGLPDGWVTDVPGVTRNEALRLCGNGVVPQQAVAALTWLLGMTEVAA